MAGGISSYFNHQEDEEPPPDPREQAFHNMVREYVIVFLILLILYGCSYGIISSYKKRREECYADDDDALVYRISIWMCTFSLSISIGAALLLPFSIISNEVLIVYPDSYYMQWLNESLVQSLWTHVFLFSNVSLFILLPFAYFFTESEGFSGSKKGIMARVNEAIVLLLLLTVLVFGMTYLICLVLGHNELGLRNLILIWHYLPFLYSCVSFLGVLLLLLCTPVGIAKLFTVLGELVVKPRFLRNIQEESDVAEFEEMHLQRKLLNLMSRLNGNNVHPNSKWKSLPSLAGDEQLVSDMQLTPGHTSHSQKDGPEVATLKAQLHEITTRRQALEIQKKASVFRRNLGYPLAMLVLLALTFMSSLLVVQNTLELLVGIKALPVTSAQQFSIGISSLSKLGLVGSSLEISLILYLWSASVVGLYSLPLIRYLRPVVGDTCFTHIIGNCALLLVLSSALPVLSRIIGFTNFDLLGDFGRIEWLGNFYIVFLYNIFFASSAAFCLMNHFTEPVRRELFKRLKALFDSLLSSFRHNSTSPSTKSPFIVSNGSTPPSSTCDRQQLLLNQHSKHD